MRGSPIIRTILILVLILASGLGFIRLTAGPGETTQISDPKPIVAENRLLARYYLDLSASARSVVIGAGDREIKPTPISPGQYSGELEIATKGAILDLSIEWEGNAEGRRFAKLVLETDGKPTFTHVFDADGAIEDFVELPF